MKTLSMLRQEHDSVSNIHKRWALTNLNPSSSRVAAIIACSAFIALVTLTNVYVTETVYVNLPYLFYSVIIGGIALFGLVYLDHLLLKRNSLSKLSKMFHVSAFSYLIWLFTLIIGILASNLMDYNYQAKGYSGYLVEGLLFAVSFRICIFRSVFGATLRRAIPIGLAAPFAILFFLVPIQFIPSVFSNSVALGFGVLLICLGAVWVTMADRAGRPAIKSTFNVLQAFLSAWTEKDGTRFEKIAEEKADEKPIGTFLMTFTVGKEDGYSLIIPEVHPGPFLSVGGSNLPFVLYRAFSRRAMVLHGVSDHALNIPSKKVLDTYLEGLKSAKRLSSHSRCSRPVLVEEGHCSVTGIRFDKVCILILSMSPKGMEDVPYSVLSSLRQYSREKGFDSLLLIDSHNAMGEPLNDHSTAQLVKTGKHCLDELRDAVEFPFLVGYANFGETSVRERFRDDLGASGLAVLALNIDGEWNLLCWADSNNMKNGLREQVLKELCHQDDHQQRHIAEVCTSDTHSTSGKRTRNGYFALGELSNEDSIIEAFGVLAHRAIESARPSTLEVYAAQSRLKVMGSKQLADYSSALDRSMRLTKIFLVGLAVTFFTMIFST